jgi:hypothetical protein
MRGVRLPVGLGWSLLPGLVGPVVVVVPLVFGEDVSGVCLVEDQDVVAYFVAEGSDDPDMVDGHVKGVLAEQTRSQCAFIFGARVRW